MVAPFSEILGSGGARGTPESIKHLPPPYLWAFPGHRGTAQGGPCRLGNPTRQVPGQLGLVVLPLSSWCPPHRHQTHHPNSPTQSAGPAWGWHWTSGSRSVCSPLGTSTPGCCHRLCSAVPSTPSRPRHAGVSCYCLH